VRRAHTAEVPPWRAKRASMSALGTLFLVVQWQAIVILTGFFVAWHWAAWRRRLGLLRIQRRGTSRSAFCSGGDATDAMPHGDARSRASSKPNPPPVTVVLPVKRYGNDTARNWRTQMTSAYSGNVEYIFVVERESDAAVAGYRSLMREMHARGELFRAPPPPSVENAGAAAGIGAVGAKHVFGASPARSARLLVAGSSTSCSQKIHSMLHGAFAADSATELVLFLDDDIRTHENTIGALAVSMDPDLDGDALRERAGRSAGARGAGARRGSEKPPFLSNGFPFDLPSANAPFTNYLTMVYHLVLLIAFSHGEWTKNVWGGCVMVRSKSLRLDRHGVVSKFRDGGYSDDLILAALCDEFGEDVRCPFEAVFPQRVCETQTLYEWWNYMRRQLFTMDTYANGRNKKINRHLFQALAYLSASVTIGLHRSAFVLVRLVLTRGARCAFPSRGIQRDETSLNDAYFTDASFLAAAVFACFFLALSAARRMYFDTGKLVCVLGDAEAFKAVADIKWRRVALAFWVAYSIVPIAAMVTSARESVSWAGIEYKKKNGKVRRVDGSRDA